MDEFIDDDLEMEDDFEDEYQDDIATGADEEELSAGQGVKSSASDPFVHLHVHSHYSLLDGAAKIESLIRRAKELGMTSLALTDHGVLYGVLEFYQKAKAAGIKPIVGYEAYIAPGSRFDKQGGGRGEYAYHLTLLAMNETGYQNLLKLGTKAYTEGFYYKPRIDRELLEQHHEGLICLSGCLAGEFATILFNGDGSPGAVEQAKEVALWYKNLFGDRYYIELMDHGLAAQGIVLPHQVAIARELDIPTVATNDVHYIQQTDAEPQEILLCINTKKLLSDPKRLRMDSDKFYLRSGKEMLKALAGNEDAVERTREIADRCELNLQLGNRYFPTFIPPDDKNSDDYLRELCLEGLEARYANDPQRMVAGKFSDEVTARVDRELSVIQKLGFSNYFLIVWDVVRFARERGIHQTARGSGVGAIVCYALNLSHVCPLEYDLLFERFLDESRTEAPDIDIDFDQRRRGEVLEYVKNKYGSDHVAQIGTFGTLAAKAAVRDVGRTLSFSVQQTNEVVAAIPKTAKTLAKAIVAGSDLAKRCAENAEVRKLIELASKVEGLARSAGTHACAVVISNAPLTDLLPLRQETGKEELITQWAAADVEKAGLLKMDFLGLRNLTILADTIDIIEQTTGQRVDPYQFPLDDKKSYELLCRGETKGIFQMESSGITELLIRMKPDSFHDLIATIALYRPGPLDGGLTTDYVEIKHGRKKAQYVHPIMKEFLEETNGIMVYQEQVMRILNKLGNIPLSQSYTCLKAISKKKEELIGGYKDQFLAGAQENGLSLTNAQIAFDLISKFAGYGFNKSHSTAYAKIAYITAYLKAHYPAEFMAALLCGDISKRNFARRDSTVEHLDDCTQMGIEVLPPNINESTGNYTVRAGKITFGLLAIKGCGEDAAAHIVRVRQESGPFASLFDFYERIDPRAITRPAVESLIKAGAFDSWGARRSQLMLVLARASKMGVAATQDRNRGQKSLFEILAGGDSSNDVEETVDIELPDVEEWDNKTKAGYEKEVLNFYLTTNPLKEFASTFASLSSHSIENALRLPDKAMVTLGGQITEIKISTTKKPKAGEPDTFAMFDFGNGDSSIRSLIWPQQYAKYQKLVQSESIVFAIGKIDRSRSKDNDSPPNFIIDELLSYEDAKKKLVAGIVIRLQSSIPVEDVNMLYDLFKAYQCKAHEGKAVVIKTKISPTHIVHLGIPDFHVLVSEELQQRIVERFGRDSFRLQSTTRR